MTSAVLLVYTRPPIVRHQESLGVFPELAPPHRGDLLLL